VIAPVVKVFVPVRLISKDKGATPEGEGVGPEGVGGSGVEGVGAVAAAVVVVFGLTFLVLPQAAKPKANSATIITVGIDLVFIKSPIHTKTNLYPTTSQGICQNFNCLEALRK
jgi:hypothetical protein